MGVVQRSRGVGQVHGRRKSTMIAPLHMPPKPSWYKSRHERYYTVNDVLTGRNVTALLVIEKCELAEHRLLGN